MKITIVLGALAVGLALVSTAAVAQENEYNGPRRHVTASRMDRGPVYHRSTPGESQEPAFGPPLSPGGTNTGGASFGGPGYNPAPIGR